MALARVFVFGLLLLGYGMTWLIIAEPEDFATASGLGAVVLLMVLPVAALGVGLSWALRSVSRVPATDIQPVDRLTWSWRRGFVAGLKLAAFSTVVAVAGPGLFMVQTGTSPSPSDVVAALVFVLFTGIIGACFGGLTRVITRTSSPNEGIRLSARNAALTGIVLSAVLFIVGTEAAFVVLGLFLGETAVEEAFAFGAALAVITIVTAGFRYGGLDVLQHSVLRRQLARLGYAPLHYAKFLDYAATELGFLQKVGGGYMFLHRYLLEHFAAMPGPGHAAGATRSTDEHRAATV